MIRKQLPAYSPVSPPRMVAASIKAMRGSANCREELGRYLEARFSADRVVLTGSGTQALGLALSAAAGTHAYAARDLVEGATSGRRPRVALPAYSCFDLVTAAVAADVEIVFYDIHPETLTPEPLSLRAALDGGAGVVVAASLYGFPLDWDGLRDECARAGAVLVEDSAQGLGSWWAGVEGGSFGDFTVLSFGRGKGWSGGGGGALLARGAAVARLPTDAQAAAPSHLMGARAWIVSGASWSLGRPGLYRLPASLPGLGLGETTYKQPTPLTSMPAIVATTVLAHAEPSEEGVAVRRRWAEAWRSLEERGWPTERLEPCRPLTGGRCGYLRYPVVASTRALRDDIVRRAGDHGVAAGYPVALVDLPEAAPLMPGAAPPLPGARALVNRLLTLPTHPRMAARDVESVLGLVSSSRSLLRAAGRAGGTR